MAPDAGGRPTPLTTDWVALWAELVDRATRVAPERCDGDYWEGRAEDFHDRVQARGSGPDSVRDFVWEAVQPGSTILDIGAGTGAWTIPLAARAARVTAVDSSASMIAVLKRNIEAATVSNIDIVNGSWPDVAVADHDYSLAVHSVYGAVDLPRFIERMIAVTRRTCFLIVRATAPNSVMAEAAEHLWGLPLDRPNFLVAYNVLLQLGLTPNVVIGERTSTSLTGATLDEALARIKYHFGLGASAENDDYLRGLLQRRLELHDGRYRWPSQARTALMYWSVE